MQVIGASDEFGYKAEQQPISVHDLHATMLHLLGIDHKRLTYRFNGRDLRLTDVHGTLIPQIVAWRLAPRVPQNDTAPPLRAGQFNHSPLAWRRST